MKSLIASICILGLVGMVVGVVVQGATEASVAATVTVQNISVSVVDGTVAYGTLPVNTTKSTLAGELADLQTATNDGNITEKLNIRGTDSGTWTLGAVAASNVYVHKFSTNSGVDWTALTTSNQTLASGVAALGTKTFDLQITTPTASADYIGHSVNVTVQATI